MPLEGYTRIEIAPDNFLERYYGWRVLEARPPQLKVLARRFGPARKLLALVDGAEDSNVEEALRKHGAFRHATMLTLVDFRGDPREPERRLSGRTIPARGAWFGSGTFVFDLARTEAELFGAIASRERSKIRKTERAGVTTAFTERPSGREIDRFLELFRAMAEDRGLDPIARGRVERIFSEGHGVLAKALGADGRILTINIVYTTRDHGYYLHGAHDAACGDPGGHLLHYKTLLYLKTTGRRWYDFGLIPNTDMDNGIFRFKRAFGGEFLPSGCEFQHVPPWMDRGTRALRALRTHVRTYLQRSA